MPEHLGCRLPARCRQHVVGLSLGAWPLELVPVPRHLPAVGPLHPLFRHGCVWLPRLGLWLDPHAPQTGPERVFVSHAHSDHIGDHREVILGDVTARLMAARLPGERVEHRLAFGERREFAGPEGAYHVTLVPAGHIFGSAMAFLEAGGETLLYTGDFKLRPGLSAEPCAPRHAGTLIMETTYGRPEYRFPPTAEVMAGVVRFCREALDNDETPVLLGYSLGKSQEILRGLSDAGLPIALHPQVARLTCIYEECGQTFPPYETAADADARGKVIIAPPGANLAALFRKLGPVRQAVLTGWAVNPGSAFRSRADAAFPLSDHADFPDLVEFVGRVAPRRVFTLHGFAADFAAHLRTLGYEAFALSEGDQLELSIVAAPPVPTAVETAKPAATLERDATPGSFRAFAETCAAIGATTSKLEKTARLAAHLRAVAPAELAAVTTWFTGAAFPSADGRTLQVGWSVIRRAVCEVAAVPEPAFRQTYLKHSDTGATVAELLASHAPEGAPLATADVAALFTQLAAARGPHAKSALLAAALRRADADEARFLVKIITGDLRIGLKEGLVEDAVAEAFAAPIEAVRRAGLLLGHPAEAALLAQQGCLHEAGLVPFRPVKVMLASPEPNAEAVLARVQEWAAGVPGLESSAVTSDELLLHMQQKFVHAIVAAADAAWLEDKYDGIRGQIHKAGGRLVLYSRDLKDVTAAFGELAAALAALPGDAILDGELLALRDGRPLPFAALQRRLGRREGDLFLGDEVPVEFVAFDLLWRDGRTLIDEPLARRRAELEAVAAGVPGLSLARVTRAADAAEVEAGFVAARARGNEGLIVKSPASPYTPGRRGLTWLKLKKAYATLDCVVVGAEYGHGKRNGVLSDYTFAVRDETTGELKTIGKAYSGLTDAEIAQLTAHFLARVRRQRGRYHEVEPDTVLEIAFDTLQPSRRHGSGLAMRFPRIARVRRDKTVADIDTLRTAWKLVPAAAS